MKIDKGSIQAIEERAEKLTDIILNLFPIDEPKEYINFTDPRYHEYTAEYPDNATFKYVSYYVLLGERVNVDSFAQMVRSVAEKLFEYDDTVIDRMARDNETLSNWWNPVFSYDPCKLRTPVKLHKGSDIYIATGFSAKDCIFFIKGLLQKYDLSIEEDFVYSARQTSLAEGGLNRVEIIKCWCEAQAEKGLIHFDRVNSGGRFIRFTTPYLDSIIPVNNEKLSPWNTSNYYFYEITNHEGNLYIQLYFYGQNLTDDMRTSFLRLAKAIGMGKVSKGYTLFYLTTKIPHATDDTPEIINVELDQLLQEILGFEAKARDNMLTADK